MSPETVIDVGQRALEATVVLAAPPLLAALGVGVLIGMFQAATQINEMTLSFVPKLAGLALVLLAGGPWLLGLLVDFTLRLYAQIPQLIG